MRYGAVETGGTKIVCAVIEEDGTIVERMQIPTGMPEETMKAVKEWFCGKEIAAFGVSTFGPVSLKKDSPMYGHILETTKESWKYYDILAELSTFGLPIGLDTDVNGACLGEIAFGAAKGLGDVLYLTVGTGIGAGIVLNGQPVHGMLHPEAGHVRLIRRAGDCRRSVCPYHECCAEGMASGTAVKACYGVPASELSDNCDYLESEADYLAQALVNYILTVSPKKIIMGGGLMHEKALFPLIRRRVTELLGGYLVTDELKDMESYISPSGCLDNQGILGCLVLAKEALRKNICADNE